MYIVHLLAGVTIGWMIFGCAPVKRHDRIVRKYPFVHKQDTVKLVDTVRITVPEVRVDTVTTLQRLLDTLIIEKENLKVKIWRIPQTDSVFVQGKCDTITVEKVLIRKVPVTIYEKNKSWPKWLALLIPFTILALAFFYKRKESTEKSEGLPPY
jgi:hypothetical protein